ncbi:MAG TPA: hypothetical protein ENH45_06780 [Nitrospirae bacterium]|nr:hypothetical protein BMS3Bbin09_00947 [bacterium BMS3Bbin09]HDZ84909.1 hypothetical protein [Nitrospirota bacterium]
MENYTQQFKIDIGDMVLKKHRIYIDTKYWIYMRDAFLGKEPLIRIEIYKKLRDLVQKEIVICPLSPHIFLELMNIGDKEKRLIMAQVMDELSRQVCFISPLNIVGQELLSFVRNCQAKAERKSLFIPTRYVFTKVPFVMGELYPTIEGISDEQMNDMRIQFFDHLSKFTLVEILNTLNSDFPERNSEDLIAHLNKGKDDNQDWKSFHEVFMYEIAGILDIVKDDIEKLWIYLYANDKGCSITPEEIHKSECVKLLTNLIYHSFDQKKINRELPFFHINASLYAFVRYNKGQRYDKNDFIDFSHTAWALPYCDAFLTEKPLHDWIRNNKLMLDKVYKTKVDYKEEAVLDYLNTL